MKIKDSCSFFCFYGAMPMHRSSGTAPGNRLHCTRCFPAKWMSAGPQTDSLSIPTPRTRTSSVRITAASRFSCRRMRCCMFRVSGLTDLSVTVQLPWPRTPLACRWQPSSTVRYSLPTVLHRAAS